MRSQSSINAPSVALPPIAENTNRSRIKCLIDAVATTVDHFDVATRRSPMAAAYIIVHDDASGRQVARLAADATLRSDERGRFSIRLEPGFYDLCVMAQAFTPACRKVLMREQRTTEVRVRLKVDPQVIEQLGDRF